MFEKVNPEKYGISSKKILDTISKIEREGYNFHSFILIKDGKTLAEAYWKPFSKDFPHRMYSTTKSFVAAAIGVLYTKGLIDLDKPFVSYFPEYDNENTAENVRKQTIRHMLTMTSSARAGYWFNDKPDDRLAHYFKSNGKRIPGAWFDYDSAGSFALGCLVEKISGKKLIDFMKENFLDEIGFSGCEKMLFCPGGHSWGDSAMICTLRDLTRFGQLVMNKGKWNGKQLIDRKYMTEAVSEQSRPELFDDINDGYAYGYQIWIPRKDTFSFSGMGGQFVIGDMKKNIIFACNADNQSTMASVYGNALFNDVYSIFDSCTEKEIEVNADDTKALDEYLNSRILRTAKGDAHNDIEKKISGKNFICGPNQMNIKNFSIDFENKVLKYTNLQGEKELKFDFNKNVFQKFPQEGYSDLVGTKPGRKGHKYDCAVSASWHAGNAFDIFVQVIDEYFGRLSMVFCFPDENNCGFIFTKRAEDFFREYEGDGVATAE